MIKKVKSAMLWTYINCELNYEETVGTFYKKELQKTIKQSLELKR